MHGNHTTGSTRQKKAIFQEDHVVVLGHLHWATSFTFRQKSVNSCIFRQSQGHDLDSGMISAIMISPWLKEPGSTCDGKTWRFSKNISKSPSTMLDILQKHPGVLKICVRSIWVSNGPNMRKNWSWLAFALGETGSMWRWKIFTVWSENGHVGPF